MEHQPGETRFLTAVAPAHATAEPEKQKPTVPELLRAGRSAKNYFNAPSYDKNATQLIINDDERFSSRIG
ncbi:hypothetical protein TFLX_04037 [Thermoflexales bacterium]|nr:hypothetical protein TFLX_04037 [Thermoflexales bacterium]